MLLRRGNNWNVGVARVPMNVSPEIVVLCNCLLFGLGQAG